MSQLPYTLSAIYAGSPASAQGQQGALSPYLASQMYSGQSGLLGMNPQSGGASQGGDPELMAALAGNYMYAGGGKVGRPSLAIVGEGDAPEYVIPTDPKYKGRAKKLLKAAEKEVNKKKIKKLAAGGKVGSPYSTPGKPNPMTPAVYNYNGAQLSPTAAGLPQMNQALSINPYPNSPYRPVMNPTTGQLPQGMYGTIGGVHVAPNVALSTFQAGINRGSGASPSPNVGYAPPVNVQGIPANWWHNNQMAQQMALRGIPRPQAFSGYARGGRIAHLAGGGLLGSQGTSYGNTGFGAPITMPGGQQGFFNTQPVQVNVGDWMHGGATHPAGGMGMPAPGGQSVGPMGSMGGSAYSAGQGGGVTYNQGAFGSPLTMPGGQKGFLNAGPVGVHQAPHPFTSPVNNSGWQFPPPPPQMAPHPSGISGMALPRAGIQGIQPVRPVQPVQPIRPVPRTGFRRFERGGKIQYLAGGGTVGNIGTPNAYNISGTLPFPNSSGFGDALSQYGAATGIPGQAGLSQALGAGYNKDYAGALGLNEATYNNVLKGFQQTMGNQVAAQKDIQGGYGDVLKQVQNTLGFGGTPWGIAQPAATAIADVNASQLGSAQQQLMNAGLGGSTVLPSVDRGINLDTQKAYGALGSNLAQTYAGYESQLGQAGLSYANQANQQNTALSQAQLAFMNSVQAPYPNAASFAGVAQQAGAAAQGEQNLQSVNKQNAAANQLSGAALASQNQLGNAGIAAQQQGNLLNALAHGNGIGQANPYGAGGGGIGQNQLGGYGNTNPYGGGTGGTGSTGSTGGIDPTLLQNANALGNLGQLGGAADQGNGDFHIQNGQVVDAQGNPVGGGAAVANPPNLGAFPGQFGPNPNQPNQAGDAGAPPGQPNIWGQGLAAAINALPPGVQSWALAQALGADPSQVAELLANGATIPFIIAYMGGGQ